METECWGGQGSPRAVVLRGRKEERAHPTSTVFCKLTNMHVSVYAHAYPHVRVQTHTHTEKQTFHADLTGHTHTHTHTQTNKQTSHADLTGHTHTYTHTNIPCWSDWPILLLSLHRKCTKMLSLTLRGFSFKYGGSPSIISIAIIPRDHISTLGPYCLRVTTSGAIQ